MILQTKCNIVACCIRKLRWVFLLQCSAVQAMLATLGFLCITSPAADAAADRRFFRAWGFS